MKKQLVILPLVMMALSALEAPASAAPAAKTAASKPAATGAAPAAAAKKDSQTNMNFEDLLVNGQYHFSDEAVTTVEEDKVLNSLIGIRTDFKDRMKQSSTLGEVKTK